SGAMLFNILLNFALVGPLAHLGLALATTISYTVNFIFLFIFLSQRIGWLFDRPFLDGVARIAIATTVMAALGYGTTLKCVDWFGFDGLLNRCATVFIPIVLCAVAY